MTHVPLQKTATAVEVTAGCLIGFHHGGLDDEIVCAEMALDDLAYEIARAAARANQLRAAAAGLDFRGLNFDPAVADLTASEVKLRDLAVWLEDALDAAVTCADEFAELVLTIRERSRA